MSSLNLAIPQSKLAEPDTLRDVSSVDSGILDLKTVIHLHIHFVLKLNHGNKLKTARQLGISRSTLYRMLDGESASQY